MIFPMGVFLLTLSLHTSYFDVFIHNNKNENDIQNVLISGLERM